MNVGINRVHLDASKDGTVAVTDCILGNLIDIIVIIKGWFSSGSLAESEVWVLLDVMVFLFDLFFFVLKILVRIVGEISSLYVLLNVVR